MVLKKWAYSLSHNNGWQFLCSIPSLRQKFSSLGPFVNIIKNLILQWNSECWKSNWWMFYSWRVVSERTERIFHHPFVASLILAATSCHLPDSLFCLALPLLQGCSGFWMTGQASSPSLMMLHGLLDETAKSAGAVVPVNGSGAVHLSFRPLHFICVWL